jgi:hypothetical protein
MEICWWGASPDHGRRPGTVDKRRLEQNSNPIRGDNESTAILIRSKAQPMSPCRTWRDSVMKESNKSCTPRAILRDISKKRNVPCNPQSSAIGSVRCRVHLARLGPQEDQHRTCRDDGVS